jgi:ubiquinone/menaquinone biosynthesis C-methylase UbiE
MPSLRCGFLRSKCGKFKEIQQRKLYQRKKLKLSRKFSSLPFKDEKFDLATAFETIYFWPDLVNDFKEVNRVLKSGGKSSSVTKQPNQRDLKSGLIRST